MQQLIASYLFQHHTCPLPGLGTLRIVNKPATTDFLNKKIHAPQPVIEFDNAETGAEELVDYIAEATHSPVLTAIEMLSSYCNHLKTELHSNTVAMISLVGNFSSGAGGKLHFQPAVLPPAFLPVVTAERVVHPEAAHHMLVGDKETTTTRMAAYYSETDTAKDYWWVWAIVLGALALLAILLYYNNTQSSPLFGNISSAI